MIEENVKAPVTIAMAAGGPEDVADRLALLLGACSAEKSVLPIRDCSLNAKVGPAKKAALWATILVCCALA